MILLFSVFKDFEIKAVDSLSKLLYNERFEDFEASLRGFTGKLDGNLLRCLKLAFLELYMTDNLTEYRREEFLALLDTLVSLPQDNLRNKVFVAVANSVGAIFYGRRGDILNALSLGNMAFNLFNEIRAQNPEVYDTYLPLGIYTFALGYISFSRGKKEEGINMVKLSENGIFTKPLAYTALVYMYSFDKKPGIAVKYAKMSLRMFPQSRTFRWILAYAYREAGMYKEEVGVYREILEDIRRRKGECKVCLAEVFLRMGEAYRKMGEKDSARENFEMARDLAKEERDPYRQKKVQEILKNLSRYGVK